MEAQRCVIVGLAGLTEVGFLCPLVGITPRMCWWRDGFPRWGLLGQARSGIETEHFSSEVLSHCPGPSEAGMLEK